MIGRGLFDFESHVWQICALLMSRTAVHWPLLPLCHRSFPPVRQRALLDDI